MSDGDRGKVTGYLVHVVGALACLAAILMVTWQLSANYTEDRVEHEQQTKDQATTGGEQIQGHQRSACVAIFEYCIVTIHETEGNANQANEDLQAQKDMANWALLMVGAAFVQTIVSVWGVFLLIKNLSISREAISIAREEQRAWISFKISSAKITHKEPDFAGIEYTYVIENIGYHPAVDVKYYSKIFQSSMPFAARKAANFFVKRAEAKLTTLHSRTVYQKQPTPVTMISHTFFDKSEDGPSEGPFLACVILYRTAGDATIRHTANIYGIMDHKLDSGAVVFPRFGEAEKIT